MDIQVPLQALSLDLLKFLPKLIAALITFVAGLLVAKPAARGIEQAFKKKIDDEEILLLINHIARITVIVVATIVALDQVNFDVTGFLAGLGIAGLTVGFALQDIAKNFIAGILLLVRQPFDIGDAISVADYSGAVKEISLRDTVLKTWDGELVILPNTEVFNSAITNYSQVQNRRRTIMIGLGYGQDAERAMDVFLKTIQELPGVLADPAPSLRAEALGDSSITLAARFWVDQKNDDLFGVHSNAILALNAAAERESIELPYPIQQVIVDKPNAER